MRLVAVREVRHGGLTYFAGQFFEASSKDARMLKAAKKATDAPMGAALVSAPPKESREMVTEPKDAPQQRSDPMPDEPAVMRRGEAAIAPAVSEEPAAGIAEPVEAPAQETSQDGPDAEPLPSAGADDGAEEV